MTRRGLVLAVVLAGLPARLQAQHFFEARGAPDSKYRYVDWNYTFRSHALVDVFYVGVPGSNELNLGGGYAFSAGKSLLVTPLVYAVFGKEAEQRGLKVALLIGYEAGGFKLGSFFGHYFRLDGDVPRYDVLDTADLTRAVNRHLDLGVSAGFFRQQDAWNPQVGPMARWNDRFGSWAVSWRFGPQNELRLSRLVIGKH